jgi:hypothetical protein
MTLRGHPDPDEAVERLVQLAREAPPEHLTPREWAGLHRLEQTLREGGHRRRAPAWVWQIAVATAVAAAGLLLALRLRDRPLTYEVTDAKVSDGGYVSAGDREASVRFSDRSELGVEPGTRLRVSGVEARGARVMLEGGSLHVHIRPEPHATWALDAGPYVVHVTGTEFDLAWSAAEQTLDLRLRKGSVVVEGPLAGAGLRVGAGQHLIASAGAGTLSLVDNLDVDPPSSQAPASGPASAPAQPQRTAAAAPAGPAAVPGWHDAGATARGRAEAQSWGARVASGDFDGVIADADRRGIDRALAESPVADLAALADAARYARRQDLAQRALMAERARYPGSLQAGDAAFFLGGLAEGQKSDGASLEWYEVYLRESAGGVYASQALGRKMMLVQRLKGADSARPVAIDYLARFPEGPYAASANKLLQAR